ncbi:hypothetical protein CLF_111984 [Clonorchis sinensis]|uniref:TFIIB-type domain-containing protein n=1 Tax=Clonorchis sinensis TaxID=79923 RepID=G7YVM5_CLOSI|nr:hypothetical protein CLF_111984 [Clonorchis sinensis]
MFTVLSDSFLFSRLPDVRALTLAAQRNPFPAVMRCPNCEGEDFTEDDATGQLICLECGTATGRYEGIIQSQEFTELRGLRVVGTTVTREKRPTLREPGLDKSVPNHTLTNLTDSLQADLALNDPQWTATQQTPNGIKKHEADSTPGSPVASAEELGHLSLLVDKTLKPKLANRPWRLCEPFTYIMRHQTNEFVRELKFETNQQKRFCDSVWRIWLNYLAITGELGEKAWRVASDAPGKALQTLITLEQLNRTQRVVTENRLVPTSQVRSNRKPKPLTQKQTLDVFRQSWQVVQRRLEHFLWIGWGSLYEPDEGREARDPFLYPMTKKNVSSIHRLRKEKLRKRRATRKESDLQTKRTKRSIIGGTGDQTDESLEVVEDADSDLDDGTFPSELPPITALADKSAVDLLRTVAPVPDENRRTILWRDYLIDKLSNSDPWKRVFWRGQLLNSVHKRGLMEFNLAILFFANITVIPTRPSVNPISWPHEDRAFLTTGSVALTTIVTLQDLVQLCRANRLTFIQARKCLPRDVFAVHDPSLTHIFNSEKLPNIQAVTQAATRLMHLLGFYQLPKFPFSWLVQRYIVILGLPEVVHSVVRLLLLRFQTCLQHHTTLITGPTLVSFVPWNRVLRVEVVAMALVVITLRLLFKFDGVSELRLSQISKALTMLTPEATRSPPHVKPTPALFDWAAWACYIDRRFPTSSSIKFNQAGGLTELTSDDLERLEHVSDLLGSTEFVPGKSIGWGEGSMYQRKHAHPDTKLALSKPVRDLLNKDDLIKPPVDAVDPVGAVESSTTDIPWLRGSIRMQSIQAGLDSRFRHTTLNYLLDSHVCTAKLTRESLPNVSDVPVLARWWQDLVDRRSHYHLICTGSWSPGCVDIWAQKHRSRLELKSVLPDPVERLIKEHDEQLVEAIQLSQAEGENHEPCNFKNAGQNDDSVDTEHQCAPADPPATASNSLGEEENSDSSDDSDASSVEPSESIQWLVELCATVCGATNQAHLLREIFALERVLFDVKRPKKKQNIFKASLSDLALYSCLDLNDQL